MTKSNGDDRVSAEVRTLVLAGAPGERLPSVRELSARHRASPVTVQRALARLAAEGLVDPRPGRGTFVLGQPAGTGLPVGDRSWQAVALGGEGADSDSLTELLTLPPAGALPLSTGYLDPALQPVGALGSALARAARRPGAWDRLPVEGLPELRDWFANQIGGGWSGHDLVISSGGQAALGSAFRALSHPGDPIVVESPTYLGALAAARWAGLRPVPVPADADGIRPDLLAAALERSRAQLVYCQTAFANPHGAVLAPDRRAAVLDAVHRAGAFLVEDDEHRDMPIDADPPPPLAAHDPDGHVVYVRSLTKVGAPGLRVAAVGARGAAGVRLRAARVVDDFFVAGPLQHAALDFVSSPAWARHRRTLKAALRERRDALVEAVAGELPGARFGRRPPGGFHLWLALPDGTEEAALVGQAGAAGVTISPGRPWFAAEPPGPRLRLSFAGAAPAVLSDGVRKIAELPAAAHLR